MSRSVRPVPDEPLVTVLVPVHNGARYLGECLDSVLRQTYGNWRLIVGDNRSTDGSGDIARRYVERDSRVRLVEFDTFLGQVDNWNRVQDLLPPDSAYVKWLCADDWLFPECIARMVEVAERHPTAALVGSYRVDDTAVNLTGLPVDVELVAGRALGAATLLGAVGYVFGSPTSVLVRHGVLPRRPFWSPDFRYFDLELCYEILRHGDFGFVPQVLSYTRRHSESVTARFGSDVRLTKDKVKIMISHGRHFLTAEQFERRLAVYVVLYLRALIRQLAGSGRQDLQLPDHVLIGRLRQPAERRALRRGLRRQVVRSLRRERTQQWRPPPTPAHDAIAQAQFGE